MLAVLSEWGGGGGPAQKTFCAGKTFGALKKAKKSRFCLLIPFFSFPQQLRNGISLHCEYLLPEALLQGLWSGCFCWPCPWSETITVVGCGAPTSWKFSSLCVVVANPQSCILGPYRLILSIWKVQMHPPPPRSCHLVQCQLTFQVAISWGVRHASQRTTEGVSDANVVYVWPK